MLFSEREIGMLLHWYLHAMDYCAGVRTREDLLLIAKLLDCAELKDNPESQRLRELIRRTEAEYQKQTKGAA